MSWTREDLEPFIGTKFNISFHRKNLVQSAENDAFFEELQRTLDNSLFYLVAVHVQAFTDIGYSFVHVPPVDFSLDASIWNKDQLDLACDMAKVLFEHFGRDGAFVKHISPSATSSIRGIIRIGNNQPTISPESNKAQPTRAQTGLKAELQHLGVQSSSGEPWINIRAALRLLVALDPFGAVCKLVWLRYYNPRTKKSAFSSVFASRDVLGYGIPNYTFESSEAAFSRAELAHVQVYFERHMPDHPFVGDSGIRFPEKHGAVVAGPEARMRTIGSLNTPAERLGPEDASTHVKFIATVACFKFGPSQIVTRLNELLDSSKFHLLNPNWFAGSQEAQQTIEKVADNVKENFTEANRHMLPGLCSIIAGFGLPRFQRLDEKHRIALYRMLFKLAPWQCCLVMLGPAMCKCMNIAQVFNPELVKRRKLARLVAKFIECQWCATCEALFEHSICQGTFHQMTKSTMNALNKFFTSGYESDLYMGRVDGERFERLSINDMPVDAIGPMIAGKQATGLPMAKTRECRSLDDIQASYEMSDNDSGDDDNPSDDGHDGDNDQSIIPPGPGHGHGDQDMSLPGSTIHAAIEIDDEELEIEDDESVTETPPLTAIKRERSNEQGSSAATHAMSSRYVTSPRRQSSPQHLDRQFIHPAGWQPHRRRNDSFDDNETSEDSSEYITEYRVMRLKPGHADGTGMKRGSTVQLQTRRVKVAKTSR